MRLFIREMESFSLQAGRVNAPHRLYLNRQLKKSKRALQERFLRDLRSLAEANGPPNGEAHWLWLACTRAAELPERVVERLHVGGLVALYLIPIVGIIPAYR